MPDSHFAGLQVPSSASSWPAGHWHLPSIICLPFGHLSPRLHSLPSKMDPSRQHSKPKSFEPTTSWPLPQQCHSVSADPLRLAPGGQQVPCFLSALRLRTLSGPEQVKLPVKGPSGHVTLSPSTVKLSPISHWDFLSAHDVRAEEKSEAE